MAKGTRVSNDTRITSLRLSAAHLKLAKSATLRKAVARRRDMAPADITAADVLREAVVLGLEQLDEEAQFGDTRRRPGELKIEVSPSDAKAFKRDVLPMLAAQWALLQKKKKGQRQRKT